MGRRPKTAHGECRKCHGFCDRMVEPHGCLALRCSYLYSYVDERSGRSYMGCMQKVFRSEIDVELFEESERGLGFGGIKMTGRPLPQCQFTVDRAFEGIGPDFECINPRFFDCADDGPLGIRALDLRDALTEPPAA